MRRVRWSCCRRRWRCCRRRGRGRSISFTSVGGRASCAWPLWLKGTRVRPKVKYTTLGHPGSYCGPPTFGGRRTLPLLPSEVSKSTNVLLTNAVRETCSRTACEHRYLFTNGFRELETRTALRTTLNAVTYRSHERFLVALL